MNPKAAKKIRQLHKRSEAAIKKEVDEFLPHVGAQAVLAMREWPFRDRFKFARWLLFGKGEWTGL